MLSVVVEEPNSMAVSGRPMREPRPGEVRVRYAGICGSDLLFFHAENPLISHRRTISLAITHTVDFHDVAGAFDLAERNPRESCKVLLDFGVDD